MRITSTRNPTVKFVRTLERTSVRQEHRLYLIEGVRLVQEAIRSGERCVLALYNPGALLRSEFGARLLDQIPAWAEESYDASPEVVAAVSQTETPAGVVAVLPWTQPPPLGAQAATRRGLVLDCLADPGNAGTILRTADAVGIDFVAAVPGTVDLFSPKVVRAGMGAHFHVALYRDTDWAALCAALPDVPRIGLDASARHSIYSFDWPECSMLAVGSEAHGLSSEARAVLTSTVRIPMRPGVESLNAAVAASVTLYAAHGSGLAR